VPNHASPEVTSSDVICCSLCYAAHQTGSFCYVPQGLHGLEWSNVKGKGKVHPRIGHEGPEGE